MLKIADMDDVKYISFKDTLLDNKIGSLHLNNMNDIPVRFESLVGVNVKDKVHYNRETNNVRNLLMKVQYDNAPLLTGVEQGTGSKQDHMHLLFTLKLKFEVKNGQKIIMLQRLHQRITAIMNQQYQ